MSDGVSELGQGSRTAPEMTGDDRLRLAVLGDRRGQSPDLPRLATGPGPRQFPDARGTRRGSKPRCAPRRAGQLAKAIHVLQARETEG